ncbi:hypothetical protein NKG94_30435 [Micromonospora sp. M12]
MTTDPFRAAPVSAAVEVIEPRPSLDYYLVLAQHGDRDPTGDPEGIVVEEFTRHHDHSTTGLDARAGRRLPAGGVRRR